MAARLARAGKHGEDEKRAANKTGKRKRRADAFMAPVWISPALQAIAKKNPVNRVDLTRAVWEYILDNKLQDLKNKRIINADDLLAAALEGRRRVNMFEMTRLLNKHCLDNEEEAAQFGDIAVADPLDEIERVRVTLKSVSKTDQQAIVKSRIGQGQFRQYVGKLWQWHCAVTDVGITDVLRASHIKPWRKSTNKERLDPFNGLLLVPNLDELFDKGYISFEEDGKIIISEALRSEDLKHLGVSKSMKLSKMHKQMAPYLNYHREKVFAG